MTARHGTSYYQKWEYQFKADVNADAELHTFHEYYEPYEPLQPRDACYGVMTNAITLFYESKEGEQIRYMDFTSLYPSINIVYSQLAILRSTIAMLFR